MDTKSKELHDFFSQYGKVFSCKVKYDNMGKCKGYGYVQFDTKEQAEAALAGANEKDLKGSKIQVVPFKTREARNAGITKYNNLFVKCIPKTYTNENLKSLFSTIGVIISAVVVNDPANPGKNKGFGFVCFKTPEEAKTAEE